VEEDHGKELNKRWCVKTRTRTETQQKASQKYAEASLYQVSLLHN
jgi:hypothetical protein